MTHPTAISLCGAATVFVVQDVLRAVEHYRDVLGFQTGFTYGQPVFYAGVERDGVMIHLQAASETKRQPGHGAVNVFVKDYPYGMRDFDIHDLDGNQLCFGMESNQQMP